jgi:hypothetical protein
MKSLLQKARSLFAGPDRRASLERRKIKRLACHQSFVCSSGKLSWPVTVVDLGFGGFKVRSAVSLGKRGDLLHLRRVCADHIKKLGGSYTTGLMARVAWSKRDDDGYETGLYLPEAPGSMRIRWYKELLQELDLDETEIFSKRSTRRRRCRLPATISTGALPSATGMVFDLSAGGALFAAPAPAMLGSSGHLDVQWGVKRLNVEISVVGVRPSDANELDLRFLHSLKFEEPMSQASETTLYRWLEELAQNE